jgi:uridylate kinase
MERVSPVYNRILLKISGEAIGAEDGAFDFAVLERVCAVVGRLVAEGVQVGIVVGGGNIWRGARGGVEMNRVRADTMGMLATVINALAIAETLERLGTPARVQSALPTAAAEQLDIARAKRHMEKGRAVIFAGGLGNPYFTTDTAAVLRGAEIGADAVLMAKNIDGVYDKDPKKDKTAVRYDEISYREAIDRNLKATDMTASAIGMESGIPLYVFALSDPENIYRAAKGEKIGTLVR